MVFLFNLEVLKPRFYFITFTLNFNFEDYLYIRPLKKISGGTIKSYCLNTWNKNDYFVSSISEYVSTMQDLAYCVVNFGLVQIYDYFKLAKMDLERKSSPSVPYFQSVYRLLTIFY